MGWRRFVGALVLFLSSTLSGWSGEIFQVSTIEALLQGIYDGETTIGQLTHHGDFGVGTFNGLDGEMVLLEGRVYRVRADGEVQTVSAQEQTPFALALFFAPEQEIPLPTGTDLTALEREVEARIRSPNYFYALRVDGLFRQLEVRSVPRQTPPYRLLTDIIKGQTRFSFQQIRGTLVGFRFPTLTRGINFPGYHFHFLAENRQRGGHLLGFELEQGQLLLQEVKDIHLSLPSDAAFRQAPLGRPHQDAAQAVEKAK